MGVLRWVEWTLEKTMADGRWQMAIGIWQLANSEWYGRVGSSYKVPMTRCSSSKLRPVYHIHIMHIKKPA